MKILVLGGTQFVGRHIVEALIAAGHEVSVFTRGISSDELPTGVERMRGDRNHGVDGLACLNGRVWDACIDVSGYTPRQVRPSVELMCTRVHRYVYMSAVSVYGDPNDRPVRESHALLQPANDDTTDINAATYGPLKVACETLVQQAYAERCTILRPQIVAGAHDPYDRFSYWVRRAFQGSEMLAPGDGTDHLQMIAARDIALFTTTVIENDLSGVYNLAGPRLTWAEFIDVLHATNVVWVPEEIIRAAGVTEFELPLFRSERGPRSSLMEVSSELAQSVGLQFTTLAELVNDVRAWLPQCNLSPALSLVREAELIRLARKNGVA